jgi:hypothetical protein
VEAEFIATAAAVKEVMWMGGMLEELGVAVLSSYSVTIKGPYST